MRVRLIFGCMIAMLMSFSLLAQKDMNKADKLLSLKAFDLAIKNYEGIIAMNPDNAKAYAQLGEAYRMTNQPLEALKAYEKAFQLSDELDASYQLNYAHTLKKVGLYAQASSWYASYSAVDPAQADYFINSTEYAKELLTKEEKYDILSFDANSEESDFAVSFFKDKIVFASFREDLKRDTDKKNDSHINQRGNQLYIAPKGEYVSADDVQFLRPDFKETHNIAPVSYSRDGRMVAFMRNNFSSSSTHIFRDEPDMSIYFAFTNESGDFGDAKPFPYNQVGYSYAFPSLGFNGSAIYFASNRPGGYGGFDIYVSYFRDAHWSTPENLGPAINSPGNEITPYFDGEQLYFSSDYKNGLGGYDVFSSTVSEGQWSLAENMGKGINSPSDDYYFIVDHESGAYYFSSNRLGGRGKEDIYVAYELSETPDEELIVEVPPAVNLEDLAAETKAAQEASAPIVELESEGDAQVVAVSAKETVMYEEEAMFDFAGATFSEVLFDNENIPAANSEVYFIQLASLAQSQGLLGYYDAVGSYGNLYRFFKPNAVKIRLGYYNTRGEAEAILPKVKQAGFADAFVTADIMTVSSFELVKATNNNSFKPTSYINSYNVESQYKVKLASYQDPLKFNVEGIKDVGRLEQWTKGRWTIFVLGGFSTLEEAKQARIKAMNRGWSEAELVIDESGILRRVTSN